MKSKRYFVSTYDSKKRNDAIKLERLSDVKALAYKAAKEGIACNFSKEWADRYVNNISPCSKLWWYEDMIRAYADYLTGAKTKDESRRVISEIEEEWEDSDEIVQIMFKFRKAADEAFEKQGIQFGMVEFRCPICGGQAQAARHHTPKNPVHAVTLREGCRGCGLSLMN